ncbi:ribbon-helix-helix domain-containing protein [Nostoc parmelioides]|uniref:CopG family transcriptional regulator n=1 Tax=Nostoc parmelioides FACHB-3921 TaxID=2692909 RepID=A0ABR8BM44_9NOSO|nr:ribbon-helix-helix domain-containing protein [Nostoc parmelioides]MBD2255193.1 CopG family transcriptional regulator [Nostoc parmelioides FACHB-3921]
MAPKGNTDRLTISIDPDLKRQFDALCRWKGTNMSEVGQAMILDWVKQNAPPGFLDIENKQ